MIKETFDHDKKKTNTIKDRINFDRFYFNQRKSFSTRNQRQKKKKKENISTTIGNFEN